MEDTTSLAMCIENPLTATMNTPVPKDLVLDFIQACPSCIKVLSTDRHLLASGIAPEQVPLVVPGHEKPELLSAPAPAPAPALAPVSSAPAPANVPAPVLNDDEQPAKWQRTYALTYEDAVARLEKRGELHQKGLLLGDVFEKKRAALNRQLAELI